MNKKYSVVLASVGNPDHGEDPNEPMLGVSNKMAHVDTLEQASQKCIDYIASNDLGAGNWSGGY